MRKEDAAVADAGTAPGEEEGRLRPLRRDARENRDRVLAAATSAMLREGRHVPMATIAQQAGVGVGTLYRRYPTREHLLGALTERSFALVRDLAQECSIAPGSGLSCLERFLSGTIAHRDQLVLPLHGGPTELSMESERLQGAVNDAIEHLLARGRADGSIRSGLSASDVVTFGAMLAQPLRNSPDWTGSARRQRDIFLVGASPRGAQHVGTPD